MCPVVRDNGFWIKGSSFTLKGRTKMQSSDICWDCNRAFYCLGIVDFRTNLLINQCTSNDISPVSGSIVKSSLTHQPEMVVFQLNFEICSCPLIQVIFWYVHYHILSAVPLVLWCCSLGGMKSIQPVKNWVVGADVVICRERGADLHMAQLMPVPLTVSCFSKIQIGFTNPLSR